MDLILLMDRSISNSYALGSESAAPATSGSISRWTVYTSAMDTFATSPQAKGIRVSLTFFSLNGGSDVAGNCQSSAYASPLLPLGTLSEHGAQLVSAMQSIKPSGLTPTVPALTGAFLYAMAEKRTDASRDKVVVLISDGFPTLCDQKAPSDVSNVIKEAATAPIPIRTYVIGTGSPQTLNSARFNLLNYANAGGTGKGPFLLDELQGADAVKEQLVSALQAIASAGTTCDLAISQPDNGAALDIETMLLRFTPSSGEPRDIPKLVNSSACSTALNGGWYLDDPTAPTKIGLCSCTCSLYGTTNFSLVHGCSAQ
jgi:hypothetical protein